jgi:hypothetical protein
VSIFNRQITHSTSLEGAHNIHARTPYTHTHTTHRERVHTTHTRRHHTHTQIRERMQYVYFLFFNVPFLSLALFVCRPPPLQSQSGNGWKTENNYQKIYLVLMLTKITTVSLGTDGRLRKTIKRPER